jgi:histidine triad (HIT) family protein
MFLATVPENLTLKPDQLRTFETLAAIHPPDLTCPISVPHHTEASMADTIFGKILAGQIPCHKVYEDDHVLAFLDINPLTRGHTLVIPKEPAERLDQLSDESAAALGRVLPRLCRAVIAATGVSQYNVLENNGAGAHQAVQHVHFHIIPKPNPQEGLGILWPTRSLDPQDTPALLAKIRAALR